MLLFAALLLPELEQLQATWAKIDDFQVTIVAHEVDGRAREERRFHLSFLRPGHAKAEVLDGPLRGMVAVWNGGDKVAVYHRGIISKMRMPFGLHDRFVTSLRGNGLWNADLGDALRCYAAHESEVRQSAGPMLEGAETVAFTLEGNALLHCPGDSRKDDATITKDEIIAARATHLPLRRFRYVGSTLVEEWDLLDLHTNTGLTLRDF